MAGYRRVNYYELCRLCTSSDGTKIHIFREEGRRRQLTTKITLCLPLQVSENDSLPKIVCSHCADKLDSFYEFRSNCVNAEAMLEGYFSSLRYSEDFLREGKVYVKDETPQKKKADQETEKSAAMKVPSIQAVTSIPVSMEGLNNLVQAASIQIVSHPESDAGKMHQYRANLETSSAQTVVETPRVRYSYQTCTNMVPTSNASTATQHSNLALSNNASSGTHITLLKTEDSTQTEFHKEMNKSEINQNHQQMDTATATYYVTQVGNDGHGQQDNPPVVSEEATVVDAAQASELHQTITFTPGSGQDMLVQFNFPNKDGKDQNNTTTILRADDRTSISQIGEFLRMKSVPLVVEGEHQVSSHTDHSSCDQCGKELNSHEQADHSLVCPGPLEDKGGGNFSCEVCAKPFKRKEHLFQHRKLHTGERPYACVDCGKAFSRKEHLVRHAVSHTGQKVHACDLCNKSFSRKDNLHKHRKTHGIAGPYVCEVCGKSFVVKHYYMMHKTTHGPSDTPDDQLPYRCDICFKGFSVKQYLTSHKLRHRRKNSNVNAGQTEEDEVEEVIEQDPLTMSTVNTAAILPPNVMHCSTAGSNSVTPLFQVSAGTNTTTYLTTTASNHLGENYRRLHST